MWLPLGALALGGALLLMGTNVYSSLVHAVDEGLQQRGDDLDVRLCCVRLRKERSSIK